MKGTSLTNFRLLLHKVYFIIFFFQLYNSLWVLTCSVISFHCFLSCVLCFQLVTPIFLKSFLTSSSHLTLGLPFSLVAYGFHLCVVLATLSLVILSTCPNQLSRVYFMYLTIFSLLIAFSNCSFVLSLYFIINKLFPNFAWEAVCPYRKILCWSIGDLHARCDAARRCPQNCVLGVHPSGGQKDRSRRVRNRDCTEIRTRHLANKITI